MNYVVFDLETQNTFSDAESSDPAALSVSVASAYDSKTGLYTTVTVDEIHKLWPIIEQTEMLVGYNSDHFDIPLLNKYYPGDLSKLKSIDLLVAVKNSFGKRLRLDTVAQATLGMKKLGNGLMAIRWWREGNIVDLKKYCEQDVRVTKELFEYALENKKLLYMDGTKKREIPIDVSTWLTTEEHRMTYSLPF
jgi:DEAD/DEAH box helicase domain-containing protein